MKLTIKHISAYLPYELYFMRYEKKCIDKTATPVIWSKDLYPFKTQLNAVSLNGFDYEKSKPILRPLSDLTKEIEVKGEKFSVNEKMYDLFKLNPNWDGWEIFGKIEVEFPYELWEKLFEWHFDVFGLIPQGLAYDINSLNNEG